MLTLRLNLKRLNDNNICKLNKICRSLYVKRKFPITPEEDVGSAKKEDINFTISKSKVTQVHVWGFEEHGGLGLLRQLKHKSNKDVPLNMPIPCRLLFGEKHKVTDVACGYGFSLFAVNSNNNLKLFGTGINADSQLGFQAQRENSSMDLIYAPVPVALPFKEKSKVKSVKAGRAHSLVLVEENLKTKVFTLGNNSYGQCGRKILSEENYSGSKVFNIINELNDSNIKQISCGQDHSTFLTQKGEIFSCGWSADGQTGQGHYNNIDTPSLVQGDVKDENIITVVSGGDCNLAINDKGDLFGWGNSEYGQLLQNDVPQLNIAKHIKIPDVGPVIDAAVGGPFCAVLNSKGEVWVWGFGLLGLGPKVQTSLKPLKIPDPILGYNSMAASNYRITSIYSGLNFLAAVSSNGDLYTWGKNKEGCLGLGHRNDQPFPLRVCIGAQVLKVSCGVDHVVALCKPFS